MFGLDDVCYGMTAHWFPCSESVCPSKGLNMRLPGALLLVVMCLTCGAIPRVLGQDALGPTASPWRPIPEMPALLWYTEFDEHADEAERLFQNGTIIVRDPFKPGETVADKTSRPQWQNDRYMLLSKMPRTRDGDRKVSCTIQFSTTPLRVPDARFDPRQVFLQFNVWTNEPGKVTVMVKAGTKLSTSLAVPRTGQWCPLKVSFGALSGDGEQMRPDALVQEIRLSFASSDSGKNVPVVCADKVFICHQTPPAVIAPMLLAWQARMSKLVRNLETDGFCYNDRMHVAMRKLSQQNRHRGPVLVCAPMSSAHGDLSPFLEAAARKSKQRGATFEVARDPRGLALTKLEDVRAFVPYLVARKDARAVLLVIDREDAVLRGRDMDDLRLTLDRLLALRCTPLVCLPEADERNRKLAAFRHAAVALCEELQVPYAETAWAFRSVGRLHGEKGKLSAEAYAALCEFLVNAYTHIHEAASGRR